MKKTKNEIITQIRVLLDELEADNDLISVVPKTSKEISSKKLVGCIGIIQGLIQEKFFDTQKSVGQVVEKLKEEGHPYSRALVSMNLLNLLKRRDLRRIKENKQWYYIIRQ